MADTLQSVPIHRRQRPWSECRHLVRRSEIPAVVEADTLQSFPIHRRQRPWSGVDSHGKYLVRRSEKPAVGEEKYYSKTYFSIWPSPQSQRPSNEYAYLPSRKQIQDKKELQGYQSSKMPQTDHERINKLRIMLGETQRELTSSYHSKPISKSEDRDKKERERKEMADIWFPSISESPRPFNVLSHGSGRCEYKRWSPIVGMSRYHSQPMLTPELPHESRRNEDIRGKIRDCQATRLYTHDRPDVKSTSYHKKTGYRPFAQGQTKSQKQPVGLHFPPETEKQSTTFGGKCEPKPVSRKFTEAASKLSTHSLYFKMKHFPRFQYVYNLVKDCKSRVEHCGVRRVVIDEMYKNVNIKIVIVGNFKDKDLHLLTKSTENKRMPKDQHIWKVQPLVCFENDFFSESNIKKCDLELESICHKILIQSDTFCDKRDKADDSIIILERNKEQIKETITSCLEKPLFLLLHELLKYLKTEGSSRLASGLIAEIEAIQKQMKSCHIKDKDVSSIVLPSASASSIVPDNIIDFLFREPDVHSFGIWRNSSFKVFVKRTDEDKLSDELIKLNPKFFEMFNLEIEKRKLEDKQTDTMQGDVILAEIQDEGGGYRQGTLGGFVISTDKERKLYALTCNHLFPEEGKQAFTENLDEIGTCSFTTRENACDFAAIEIKKEFSKNCDETFHKEDSGKTNAYVFSENLKDIGIVHKIGATTKGTKGTIISSEYYDKLKDNTSREHVFLVQGTQGNFSKEGDSGSLVFTRSKNARQTSVDVLGMVIGNKVTVLDDDEEQENQVENKPGVTKGSEKIGHDSKNEKVDAKESSNTSSFQEGTFAASSSYVPDNISYCFRIDTALQLFKEKQGEEVKFKDDLSPSTSLSSDSDDTNRDTP